MALRADVDARLTAADAGWDDDGFDRKQVHDRLHGFLMGFSALRALDGGGGKMMVADFVEAVEDQPIGAVHRACKAWNQRAFKWPNYSFPPTPPDMRRAVNETITEMKVERYDLDAVLNAQLPPKLEQVTQEQRDAAAAEAVAVIAMIAGASLVPHDPMPTAPSPERMEVARELESRRIRREASAVSASSEGSAP
ncbi:hypothetical protein [Methylorubrum suomiense]|uniref:hypothetical protein n=1 Tax=Methylorubrum suomiense TaxID=144191 RepID=UPI001EE34CF1|nr:hypothetical protein [Methylorubrum suomiense]